MSSGYDPTLLDSTGAAARSKYADVPDPEGSSGGSKGWGTSITGHDTTPSINTTQKVKWGSARLAAPYYYNGPRAEPWDMHSAQNLQREASMETWSNPMKGAVLDQYAVLLKKYGHTNQPGTLWAIAQSGLDVEAPGMSDVLKMDANIAHDNYAQSMPQQGDSVNNASTDPGGGVFDNMWPDDMWKIPEFASRNIFSALSMPMEAVQGSWRGVGGALAEGDVGQAVASAVSIIPPVAAIIDGSVYADNEFVNPWEQTDFGQTLLYGASRDWTDAFTTAQAGLDHEAALTLIESDPAYAGQRQAMLADPSQRDSILTQVAKDNALFGGPGWFIDETSQVGEAQRQATFNSWSIPGPDDEMTAWTLGRGIIGAQMGADWAGYGFTSGLIDAVTSIASDPTIIGAKFGVVSKTARGVGKVAELAAPSKLAGAERALTFGKERAKEMKSIGLVNQNATRLVDDYNRLTQVEGTPLYNANKISLEEWGQFDPVQHVSAVKLMKQASETEKALKTIEPSTTDIWKSVKSIRRNAVQRMRGWQQVENAYEDVPRLARQQKLWEEYDSAARYAESTGKRKGLVYSQAKEKAWVASLSEEDRALWAESHQFIDGLVKRGEISLTGQSGERVAELPAKAIDYYAQKVAKGVGVAPPKAQYADRVAGDAVRMTLAQQLDEPLASLDGIDTAGTTAARYEPGLPMVSVTDESSTISYWTGAKDPMLVEATDFVASHPGLNDVIADNLILLSKHPDLTFKKIPVKKAEKGTLPDALAKQIKDIENVIPGIADDIRNPGMTFSQMYNKLIEHGLEGFLYPILHENGIDGINSVNRKTRDGVWFGDHPLLESYHIPESTFDNAAMAGGMVDGMDEFIDGLRDAIPAGVRSMTRSQAEEFANSAGDAMLKTQLKRAKIHADAVGKAREQELVLEKARTGIDDMFSEPEKALKTMMQYEAGMTLGAGRGATVDPAAMRWFLFGNSPLGFLRARAMKAMANIVPEGTMKKFKGLDPMSPEYAKVYDEVAPELLGDLIALTKAKWSAETYNAVLRNAISGGGEEGLYKVLAPRLGVDVMGSSLTASVKKGSDQLTALETVRSSNGVVKRTAKRMMGERPGQREIDLDNSKDIVDALIKYGMYVKLDPAVIREATGRIMLHDGRFDAVPTNVDVIKAFFNSIGDQLVDNVDEANIIFGGANGKIRKDAIKQAMKTSTRLFLGGNVEKPDTVMRQGSGSALARFIDDVGNSVSIPSQQLESELITGKLSLPNVDEWQSGLNRLGMAISRFETGENLYKVARSIYDDFFRTSLLVFRMAYVIRNSAEMQVRMFLNGHHSVFSDPVSLAGMVLGGKNQSTLAKSFSPYTHTILDTAFDVGNDEQAAFANGVQDFFALTRQANSLTDPRVYKSTVFRGWKQVTVDQPTFAEGWANELLMQNRSFLSRAVLGEIPADFAHSPSGDLKKDAVDWLLSDATSARTVRAQLEASNEEYQTIFASRAMTMDYLWDNQYSVFNRTKQFTMSDPVLEDFIRTGRWLGDDIDETISRIPRVEKRVDVLRSALRTRFFDGGPNEAAMRSHMMGESGNGPMVTVPWVDPGKLKQASKFVDQFFRFANKIERLGSVGPEFQMAYWDRIAELAPGLRASEVDQALEAARTTLSPLKKMTDGKLDDFGKNHPAWEALNKAKKENSDGLLKLQEIHAIAMDHAADAVKDMFYDAARRNNFWGATRLMFPFGQAWGNTITEWTKLGAKNPIQVYKAQKVLNAAGESGSEAIYDAGGAIGAFGQYEPGMAPWDQDPNGGFFYQNQYGETSFLTPFTGKSASIPLNLMGRINGYNANIGSMDMQSGTQSLNMALGSDQINPGMSFLVPMVLDSMPDWEITAQLKAVATPFGERDVLNSAIPAWAQYSAAGLSSVPIIGDALNGFLSSLSPALKNRNARDAVAILTASGDYNLNDPLSVQKLQEDAANLGSSMLMITGIYKNWMPTSPTPQMSVDLGSDGSPSALGESPNSYALAMFGKMYPQYLDENGGDETAAKDQMLRDFGPAAIFALTRNKQGYMAVPASQARLWAMDDPANLEAARAYPDYFGLFFPQGDYSDITTKLWMDELTKRESSYKSPDEITNDNITWMQRVQNARIDFFEGNDLVSSTKADAMRADLKETYADTDAGSTFNSMTATRRVEQIDSMYRSTPGLRSAPASTPWDLAMGMRQQALNEARARSGDPSTTLSGKRMIPILEAYKSDLDALLTQYPDFKLLHGTLSKEWD